MVIGDNGMRCGGVGSDCSCIKRTDSALDSVSNPYSEAEEISVDDSRHSSCPAYTIY